MKGQVYYLDADEWKYTLAELRFKWKAGWIWFNLHVYSLHVIIIIL